MVSATHDAAVGRASCVGEPDAAAVAWRRGGPARPNVRRVQPPRDRRGVWTRQPAVGRRCVHRRRAAARAAWSSVGAFFTENELFMEQRGRRRPSSTAAKTSNPTRGRARTPDGLQRLGASTKAVNDPKQTAEKARKTSNTWNCASGLEPTPPRPSIAPHQPQSTRPLPALELRRQLSPQLDCALILLGPLGPLDLLYLSVARKDRLAETILLRHNPSHRVRDDPPCHRPVWIDLRPEERRDLVR